MTALIEPYSGYVLAWLLTGLMYNTATMLGIIQARWPRQFKPRLIPYLVIWLIAPVLLILHYLKWVGEAIIKAASAFKRFGRFNSGMTYMLFAVFYGYSASEVIQRDIPLASKAVAVFILVATAILLCHAAKDIQDKAKEQLALTTEPVKEETLETLLDHILNTPEVHARTLAYSHQKNLADIKLHARKIMELNDLRYLRVRNQLQDKHHVNHRTHIVDTGS